MAVKAAWTEVTSWKERTSGTIAPETSGPQREPSIEKVTLAAASPAATSCCVRPASERMRRQST